MLKGLRAAAGHKGQHAGGGYDGNTGSTGRLQNGKTSNYTVFGGITLNTASDSQRINYSPNASPSTDYATVGATWAGLHPESVWFYVFIYTGSSFKIDVHDTTETLLGTTGAIAGTSEFVWVEAPLEYSVNDINTLRFTETNGWNGYIFDIRTLDNTLLTSVIVGNSGGEGDLGINHEIIGGLPPFEYKWTIEQQSTTSSTGPWGACNTSQLDLIDYADNANLCATGYHQSNHYWSNFAVRMPSNGVNVWGDMRWDIKDANLDTVSDNCVAFQIA